jgi:hypothetical protein
VFDCARTIKDSGLGTVGIANSDAEVVSGVGRRRWAEQ